MAAALAFALLTAAPAHADWGWLPTTPRYATACWNQVPVSATWSPIDSNTAAYSHVYGGGWVRGEHLRAFRQFGSECGFGLPITDVYDVPAQGLSIQYFYMPGTCELRFTVIYNAGGGYVSNIHNYFC